MANWVFEKLFLSAHYFTIALRRKSAQSIMDNPVFCSEFVIPARLKDWVADPILVDDGGKTYMFYEAVKGDKGRIEVVEVNADCSVSQPVVILENEHHYSYPFVFRYNNTWYMIPESSSQNEIALYCATKFPYEWEKKVVLLSGVKAVDTTVFEYRGNMYLLTYITQPPTECVCPRAYRMQFTGSVQLSEIPWRDFDPLESRGAGAIFAVGQTAYRPAQINEPTRYGNALAFYEVQATDAEYSEIRRSQMLPSQLQIPKVRFDGLHTYSVSEKFEAIDIRCRDVDCFKVFRKLRSRFLRK